VVRAIILIVEEHRVPRRSILFPILLTLLLGPLTAVLAREDARGAADRFGEALTRADMSLLRALLPDSGKVQLKLERLGPERGYFSAGQVQALLDDFLSEGAVETFRVERVESEGTLALVHGLALLTDRRGEQARVRLHLAFGPEEDRWVLRELRELEP
jgi:hypothetical protein